MILNTGCYKIKTNNFNAVKIKLVGTHGLYLKIDH